MAARRLLQFWSASSRQKGFALLLTLWVIALIIVMATEFAYTMRTEVKIAINYRDEVQAYYLAWAGVQAALYEIGKPFTGTIIGSDGQIVLVPPGTVIPGLSDDVTTDVKEAEYPTAPIRSGIQLGRGYFSYTIEDEDGKFNLNSLISGTRDRSDNIDRFRNLLVATGTVAGVETDTIVDSVLDWVDADDLHRINGAEDEYYEKNYLDQGQAAPYHPKNGRFDTLEELLLIQGMTPEIFYGSGKAMPGGLANQVGVPDDDVGEAAYLGIAQFLTVSSTNTHVARINKNTAPSLLLEVLFPNEAEDMQANRDVGEQAVPRMQASTTYTIQATGQMQGSPVSRTIKAVVHRQNPRGSGRIRISYWKDSAEFVQPGAEMGFADFTGETMIQ